MLRSFHGDQTRKARLLETMVRLRGYINAPAPKGHGFTDDELLISHLVRRGTIWESVRHDWVAEQLGIPPMMVWWLEGLIRTVPPLPNDELKSWPKEAALAFAKQRRIAVFDYLEKVLTMLPVGVDYTALSEGMVEGIREGRDPMIAAAKAKGIEVDGSLFDFASAPVLDQSAYLRFLTAYNGGMRLAAFTLFEMLVVVLARPFIDFDEIGEEAKTRVLANVEEAKAVKASAN